MNRTHGWGLLLLLVVVLCGGLVAGVSADETVTQIDADHELATEETIQTYHAEGVVSGDAEQIQLTLTVAESADDVGIDRTAPLDWRNDYLRLEYDEEIDRTVRVFIPAEMVTPYTREGVEALNNSHTTSFEPIRDGEFLAVTVVLEGEDTVVFPLDKSASASYDIMDRANDRVERATGISLSGDEEWTYVDGDDMAGHTVIELEADPDAVEIQFDARHGQADELWVTMPEGDDPRAEVYWYYSSSDDLVYIVPKAEDPPAVRYKTEATLRDRIDGAVNDARQLAENLRDRLSLPWTDSEEVTTP
ncbi:hypothetical protein AArcSl_1653 [Halalkaliarchaeum desulfuricum]|uniref:Uncharacterized protein n=1 Tax=Halalkaliarchaeum desulfuricum TaxID=2055893 RepID=A0A343TJL0_9EURY|nr:hypothetical protein [Halalkaliarchaeum desulfuricum]AUX09282.1 hypothetical protein AArcSl_1653 [Halalkaliarchaeum desulfuricum]